LINAGRNLSEVLSSLFTWNFANVAMWATILLALKIGDRIAQACSGKIETIREGIPFIS
jgi:hypothetical protein